MEYQVNLTYQVSRFEYGAPEKNRHSFYLVVVVFDPVFGVKQDDGVRQANFAAKRCPVVKKNTNVFWSTGKLNIFD